MLEEDQCRFSSSNIKCFRSVLKASELVLFNHMAEKRKTKRVPNEMINRDLEKKRWLILESVVEDTKFHRSIQVIIKDFEFGHGFTNNKD
jgi:hypothetical protein